jgi:hypothetical protein
MVDKSLLSPVVERYLQAWIGVESWHTNHGHDLSRFYRFVRAVMRYSKAPITGGDLRAILLKRFSSEFNREYLAKVVDRYCSLFEDLYAFSKDKSPFPDVVIEKLNISRYYHTIVFRSNDDESYIETKMSHDWGDDWKEKLKRAQSK